MKKLVLLLFFLLTTLFVKAAVKIGDLYYNLDSSNMTAEVTTSSIYGDLIIRSRVSYDGKFYSVTSIGYKAFYECKRLESVTIPESVTSIGSSAFYNCSGLTSVTIPESVTSIDYDAFDGCSLLERVNISSIESWCKISFGSYSANPLYYAHNLYLNEEKLKDLVIPNSVTSIGNYTFEGCSALTSVIIPNSVTTIGYKAFDKCGELTRVTIPNSVTSIGSSAFDGCSGLTRVNISSVESWCKITFGNSSANPLLNAHHLYVNGEEVKDLVIPDSITEIGNYVFDGCSGLTSVTIPNSVTEIGSSAFENCSGLTSVTIQNSVTSIGDSAFAGCLGLTKVNISSLESWCKISFGNNFANPLEYAHHLYLNGEEIKDLVIPDSITEIGYSAFSGCSGLTSVTIPESVTSIGIYAFYNCSGLTSVHISSLESWCKIAFSYEYANPLSEAHHLYLNEEEVKDLVIPDSISEIGNYVFSGCTGLTSVTIPNSVTSIGGSAFSGCSGLTNVTIPNSVTSIASYAFYGCTGLTNVTIPNSVTSIASYAFSGCSVLTNVTIGNSVTQIASYAFFGCSGLRSVAIGNSGNSITEIGSYAFSGCSGLTSVTIGNSVKSIDKYAFSGCSSLKEIIIEDGKSTLNLAYNSSSSSSSGLFSSCPLEKLYMGRNLSYPTGSSYVYSPFANQNNLTEVTIGNSVTEIGNYAFYGCSGLTSVTIGNSVKSIGDYSFSDCLRLGTVYLGEKVEVIGPYAFNKCEKIMAIYSYAQTPPYCADYALIGIDTKNCTLYVPAGCKNEYKAEYGWDQFSNIVEMVDITTGVELNESEITINLNEANPTFQLTASVLPDNASNRNVIWNSSDSEVASVDDSGLVTGHSVGTAIITVTTEDGGFEATCKVNVVDNNSGIEAVFDSESDRTAVYNLQGVYVGDSVDNLAPGIYIVRSAGAQRKIKI